MLQTRQICPHRMGKPCVTLCLSHLTAHFRLTLNMFWRAWTTKKITNMIVPSQYMKDLAVSNGIRAGAVSVVPHFTNKNIKLEYIRPNENLVLYVGRMDRFKGVYEFISALNLIQGTSWKAFLIGDGECLKQYEKIVKQFRHPQRSQAESKHLMQLLEFLQQRLQ